MGSEKFCLRWNDFESNISNAFRELRDDKEFFDVTIACDDEQIQTHKVILSACSPLFRNILRRNPHQHPLLYLKGVKYTDLQSVLNFMYHGEVNVAQEELNSFLAVAEDLRVKGLTQNQSSSHQSSSKQPASYPQSRSPLPVSKPLLRASETEPPPPHRRSRPPHPTVHDDDDIQEVVPIKSEPRDSVLLPSPHVPAPAQPQVYSSVPQPIALNTTETQSVATYQEETGYEDYGDYQEQVYTEGDSSMDHTISLQGLEPGKGENRNVLNQCIKKSANNLGQSVFECSLCGQKNSQRVAVLNHVESVHFPNSFVYTCKYCQAEFHSQNARNVHVSRNHKKVNKY